MSEKMTRAVRVLGVAAAPLAASVAQGTVSFSDPTSTSISFASGGGLPSYSNPSFGGEAVNGNQGVKLFGGFENLLGQDAYEQIILEASGEATGQGYGAAETVPVAWDFGLDFLTTFLRGGDNSGILWGVEYSLNDEFGFYSYSTGDFVFNDNNPGVFQPVSGSAEIDLPNGFGTGTWTVRMTISFDSNPLTAHTVLIPNNSLDFGTIPTPSAALVMAMGAGLVARRRR